MGALGIPIPQGPTLDTIFRLSMLMAKAAPRRLVLLGDLWHAKAARTAAFLDTFAAWRQAHESVEIILVEGNHDAKAGPLPLGGNVREVKEPHTIGPFALCHYPEPCPDGYVLGGHIHPAVMLEGRARQALKLPCFWFGERVGVLPAFGSFTGCGRVSPIAGDQVLVIADGRVTPAQMSA